MFPNRMPADASVTASVSDSLSSEPVCQHAAMPMLSAPASTALCFSVVNCRSRGFCQQHNTSLLFALPAYSSSSERPLGNNSNG